MPAQNCCSREKFSFCPVGTHFHLDVNTFLSQNIRALAQWVLGYLYVSVIPHVFLKDPPTLWDGTPSYNVMCKQYFFDLLNWLSTIPLHFCVYCFTAIFEQSERYCHMGTFDPDWVNQDRQVQYCYSANLNHTRSYSAPSQFLECNWGFLHRLRSSCDYLHACGHLSANW